MKSGMRWILLIALALGLAPIAANDLKGAGRHVEAVKSSGRGYLPLNRWARNNGLEVRWLKRDETLQLDKNGTKILLTVDSRDAQVNGVHVVLLFPVTI